MIASEQNNKTGLKYFCDDGRHIVCLPFSIENLHRMAGDLDVKRCWYHYGTKNPHYDMPAKRIDEIKARCEVVSTREIMKIIQGKRTQ